MSDVAAGKLLTSNDIRELCAQLNIRPTKTWAKTSSTIQVRYAKLCVTPACKQVSRCWKLGPGLGSLTLALLEAGAQVSAVEIDPPPGPSFADHRPGPLPGS